MTAQKKIAMITETLQEKRNKNGYSIDNYSFEEIGDDHLFTGLETPMRSDAFKLSDLSIFTTLFF